MTRRSWWLVVALILVAALVSAGLWFSSRDGDEQVSWMFSHTSDGAALTENPDGTYKLTLTGADPHAIAFTDRPSRDSAIMSTADLIDAWPVMFADSDPNAVLVEHQHSQAADSMVVELSDPVLHEDSLSFTAKVQEDESIGSNLKQIANVLHDSVPATLSKVSLFIDDVSFAAITYTCTVQPPTPITVAQNAVVPGWTFERACSAAGGSTSRTYVPPPGLG